MPTNFISRSIALYVSPIPRSKSFLTLVWKLLEEHNIVLHFVGKSGRLWVYDIASRLRWLADSQFDRQERGSEATTFEHFSSKSDCTSPLPLSITDCSITLNTRCFLTKYHYCQPDKEEELSLIFLLPHTTMELKSKLIIGIIVKIFAISAITKTRRGWKAGASRTSGQESRLRRRSSYVKEYEVVEAEEAEEAYSIAFTSMEGEFEWSKLQAPGYLDHELEDNTDYRDETATEQRDTERRLKSQRTLKTYYHDGEYTGGKESGDDEYDGIYTAGDVRNYSANTLSTLLRKHEYVALTKKWRGNDHLVLTQICSIKRSSEPGAYYCVDNKTVCVTVKSMARFYGEHVTGGKCGTLPLDEDIVEELPDAFQQAYFATVD